MLHPVKEVRDRRPPQEDYNYPEKPNKIQKYYKMKKEL